MREKKYHIYLTDDEQSRVIQSLTMILSMQIRQMISMRILLSARNLLYMIQESMQNTATN